MASRKMTIAFFGSSLISAYWNGAATYYRGLIRALHQLGHRVTFFEPNAYQRQQHRDIADPPYAAVRVYPAEGLDGVRAALEEAAGADVVIKASGVGVFDELLEAAVPQLKTRRNAVVYWDVDAPATLGDLRRDPPPALKALIPRYDLVLTYGGGRPVTAAYEKLGARRCVPIYNALDSSTHFPVPPEPRFRADLAFLGNRMPDRKERVHEFFFKAARLLPRRRFLLGGSGWAENAPRLPNVRLLGHVFTTDHNALNSSALAVLNINRQSMADMGFSPTTRIFEAAGAGACLITDAWPGIECFLTPGSECLVAETGEQAAAILEGLDAEKARRIGTSALLRVRSEHTYDLRAAQVQTELLRLLAA